jgi:flagellar basal body P-ring formation protein FlgA
MTTLRRFPQTVLVLGFLVTCAGAAGATEIAFRPNASVTGPAITLRDVATISGGDPAVVARLEQTVLGPAPAPGRNARLDFEEIRSRLDATGVSTADANFSGASVVVVSCTQPAAAVVRRPKRKSRTTVSPAQVRRAEKILTQSVRQSLRGKSRQAANLFLEVVVDPADVPIVLAGATEGFELSALDPHNVNAQNVQVRTQDSQGQAIRFQIQCVVSEKPRVPVLTRSVTAGEVIREDDLNWKQADSTEGLATKAEEIIGREAKKSLHADDPVHVDDIRTIPLVRSNDIVTGIWQKGGIRITSQFKAKSDGGKGDVITLVQLTGRDQVLARVTDVHEAQIVSSDAVRTANPETDDAGEQAAPAQAVAYGLPTKRKRRKTNSSVINTAATDEAGANGSVIQQAAASRFSTKDAGISRTREEPTEESSR